MLQTLMKVVLRCVGISSDPVSLDESHKILSNLAVAAFNVTCISDR